MTSVVLSVTASLLLVVVSSASTGSAPTGLRITISDHRRLLKDERLDCTRDADAPQRCRDLLELRPVGDDRCLQIWGGPEQATITVPNTRERVLVTRANSCEMYRWRQLQKLLRR